ncbi:hypothetical protein MF672_002560 [Actinomadura sp. ATCC 31491]|uniref:Uncharacterized protein n=1 Tax=Actinomadura luzonensis TaxID=2805427 RepID=A0ABT0FKV2_9ACTN|nr:hypothetical protein [Actinomadura luzonensis]MCK2212685.1 hypothetical protein [Actinomadura luzonensis]
MVIASGLALVSFGAILWCTLTARPVAAPAAPRNAAAPNPWVLAASKADAATGSARRASTEVLLSLAADQDLTPVPAGRIDPRQRQIKVTVVHTLRMAAQDPLLGALRQGGGFPGTLQQVTDAVFGAVKVDGPGLAPTTRDAPVLNTDASGTLAVFTVTLLRQVGKDALLTLDFAAPNAFPLIVQRRTISVLPGAWTVLRQDGITPMREQAEWLEFAIGATPVVMTLAPDSAGFPDVAEEQDFSWATALGVLTAVVLLVFLLRSLGRGWWQRLPNRELVIGLALAAPTLVIPLVARDWSAVAYVVLFVAVPALALRHAGRMLPTSPPWNTRDLLVVTGLGVVVGLGMLIWSWLHGQLGGQALLTGGAVAALAAAGAAVGFSVDLGVRPVVVRLAVLSAEAAIGLLALALWLRALLSGVYPPDSTRLVLALSWAMIPVAAVAVATKQWSRGAVVGAVAVSLLVQGWPTEWLDTGSWSLAVPQAVPSVGVLRLDPIVRGVLGLLLLGFVMLVLRLRRLGGELAAVDSQVAESTMIAVLMVLYITPSGITTLADINVPLPLLAITSVVAWATARWLLSGPHVAVVEPTTQEQHRQLVRAAIHKRLLLVAEQELYRVGRGRLGSGEMSMADFDQRRHALEAALAKHGRHPETAFATAAACTPWLNGVHAFTIGLLLSLPFTIVYGLPQGVDLTTWLFDARYLLTLPAFGFLYGYFYPRVRGTQPMTKALHLTAAALLTELSGYLSTLAEPDIGAFDKAQVAGIVVGQVTLVCVGLGLFWEWRIMHLADEPWARVRNLRSMRSLAAPTLALALAIGTTAATSAAGTTVDHILKGDQVSSGGGP